MLKNALKMLMPGEYHEFTVKPAGSILSIDTGVEAPAPQASKPHRLGFQQSIMLCWNQEKEKT